MWSVPSIVRVGEVSRNPRLLFPNTKKVGGELSDPKAAASLEETEESAGDPKSRPV